MAEPLKNNFGPDVATRIADAVGRVHPTFDHENFLAQSLDGFDALELTPRAHQIADAMAAHLPEDRAEALDLVVATLGPELENCDPDDAQPRQGDDADNPMAGFFYMPHGYFVADHCGHEFEASMRANYEITKRFTSEFSIRTCLTLHTDPALKMLHQWATDPNVHVRRLVSEGTRPRLPWAGRLKHFQTDPAPVLELLELLKDDPVEYVRRSVANNLNDIAKDHPDLVVATAKRWWADGDTNRQRLVRHALRTLIKQGDPGALDVLGYGQSSPAAVSTVSVTPESVAIGGKVRVVVELTNPSDTTCGALVDLRVHFVKADGSTSPKVFKGGELSIEPGEVATIRKTISVAQHSTRKHYPGVHTIDAIINGSTHPLGRFELTAG